MAGMTGTGCVPGGVLSAWLDDAATSEEGRTIDAHLPGCAACTSALIELGAVRRVVRTLPTLEVPAGLLLTGHPDDALSAYLDGELPTIEIDTVSAHLAGCASCRGRLHDLDGARTAVRALPRLDPPIFTERPVAVGGAVAAAPLGTGSVRRRVGLGVAIATGVAAVMVGFALVRSPAPTPVDVGDLASRHGVRSAVDPGLSVPAFELAGDQR